MQDLKKYRAGNTLNTIHISVLPLWDLGRGKGRVSTYLPLKALVDRGHRVWFLTSFRNQESAKIDGIEVKRLRTIVNRSSREHLVTITAYLHMPFFIFASILQSLIIALRHKPDVIYAHDIYSSIAAFALSRIFGARYILKLYGVGFGPVSVHRFTYMALKLPADLFIVTNDGTSGRNVLQSYGVSESRICFWVNGISRDWLDEPMDYASGNTLPPNNERIVLSLCRLSEDKQVDLLIKAVPNVVKVYSRVRFVIVGDGHQRGYLEDLVQDLEVSDFVKFTGAILHERVVGFMNSCHIFVSMNALSSICNPVLEAMICGRPVIALNTGATKELIKDNYNGLLVDVSETDKIADYILLLLNDDDLRRTIGRNAQKFMLDNWPTWEQRTNLEADLVEALCSNDSGKVCRVKEKADAILNINNRLAKEYL